ncbi:MFS general substrate transporter [Aaosphaeria arxii CBS 175.79]|uniref:MFS general substrate transporter n=1 Tax=Aaosphaeria arxii CBS 175.79 TaxID=1450172 RepID=A0A6A5XYA0_9PLEO|nr:MFS general substrate transporter [Aaosphaeria arxii CBS 175.79]KAF2017620.1 MFS general substrate transporter [Aaosphaeria arxii CBS 175.79]
MREEHKGSTPGLIVERNQLTKVNTFPSVEFTIPPSDPPTERVISKCHSHQTPTADALAQTEKSDALEGGQHPSAALRDEEALSVTTTNQGEVSYPEGGLEAWLVVLGSFLGAFIAFGMMNTIGIFHSYLGENQLKDYSESTVGWIFSVFVFLSFFCGIQIGPIFDAHGPKLLVATGSALMVATSFLLGVCTQYWHFLIVFGILGGTGASLIFTPAFGAIGHFFLEKRANATGIAAAGGSLGGIIFPLMLQDLLPRVGFAWSTRIMGFIFLFCGIIAVSLVKSRLPPKRGQSVMPDLLILRHRGYLLLTLGTYFMEWALFVPITYLTTFATSTGTLSSSFSYQLIAIFNAGSCLGRWAPGYLADRLGRFNSMIATLALCAATSVTLWLPTAVLTPTPENAPTIKALIIVFAVTFGFASGSNISLTPVCVGQLCETNQYGRYYATCYTIVSFGTLTGIPIAGALIQAAGGSYWGVVVWTFVCYLVSLGCFLWSRACQVGWKLGEKY